MANEDKILRDLTKAESDGQKIRQLEEALKRAREDLQEYIMAEKVMIAAGKISEATVRGAHEIVSNLK
jgi:hypothetical protein